MTAEFQLKCEKFAQMFSYTKGRALKLLLCGNTPEEESSLHAYLNVLVDFDAVYSDLTIDQVCLLIDLLLDREMPKHKADVLKRILKGE